MSRALRISFLSAIADMAIEFLFYELDRDQTVVMYLETISEMLMRVCNLYNA